MEINNASALELWKSAIKYIKENGEDFTERSGRVCREVLRLEINLTGFSDILAPIETMSNSKKWIYPKLQEIEGIMLEGTLSRSYIYSYGERIFSYFDGLNKIDQIGDYVIPLLQKDPLSRRAVVNLWNPAKDARIDRKVVPGMICLDFKIRNGKLHLSTVVRSNDVFIGWPANIYQLFILGKFISEKLKVELGSISTFSMSAHIFNENLPEIDQIIG
jgi:thymidylate synthase